MGRYPVAGSGPDCKSGAFALGWFESNPAHQSNNHSGGIETLMREHKPVLNAKR